VGSILNSKATLNIVDALFCYSWYCGTQLMTQLLCIANGSPCLNVKKKIHISPTLRNVSLAPAPTPSTRPPSFSASPRALSLAAKPAPHPVRPGPRRRPGCPVLRRIPARYLPRRLLSPTTSWFQRSPPSLIPRDTGARCTALPRPTSGVSVSLCPPLWPGPLPHASGRSDLPLQRCNPDCFPTSVCMNCIFSS
jgi:hypothetical protein